MSQNDIIVVHNKGYERFEIVHQDVEGEPDSSIHIELAFSFSEMWKKTRELQQKEDPEYGIIFTD